MADQDAEEGAAGKAAPKSKKKLIIIGAAAAFAILGGAGGYFMLAGGKGGEHGEAAAEHGEEKGGHGEPEKKDAHGKDAAAKGMKAYVDLPEMTVNLATVEREKQRYVRLNVALEVDKTEMADAIKPMMPRVLDSFQTHLRELRPDDIRGSSGAYRLKEELLRRVNVAVAPAKVDAVLFKDMVVQ